MSDYERIARAIRFLDEHYAEQPGLDDLAESAGLNRFHFHRLFARWAGITPKDFLQCLTLAHARELLRRGESILDAALEAGLSGPGRLHDLCVNLESASPGELKNGGAAWTIHAGFAESPFGTCLVAEGPRGICHLSFVENGSARAAWSEMRKDWPRAQWRRNDSNASRIAAQIFMPSADSNVRPALRAFVTGTPFQVRVWRALLQVPIGHLTTYGRVARGINAPGAARAVGTAVGQNPLAYLIPCHRVIRETGVVDAYRWGRARKRALMVWESSREKAAIPA